MITKKNSIRFLNLSLLLFLAATIIFACKKDEEKPVNNPSIELASPDSNFLLLEVNAEFNLSFVAASNPTSGAALTRFQLTSRFEQNEPETLIDSTLTGNTFSLVNYTVTVSDMPGTQVFSIIISDADGASGTYNITVTIQPQNALAPSISFKGGNYVNNDTVLTTNTPVTFGITATANTTTNAKIKNLTVRRKYESTPAQIVASVDYDAASIEWEGSSVAHPNPGDELWTFRVTDEGGESAVVSLTITTESSGPGVASYQGIVLGSTSGSVNQGISLVTGETLKLQELTEAADQKKVDLVYFEDDTYGNTLVAPKHNVASSIYGTTIGTWDNANKRQTFISKKPGIATSTFDVIDNISQLTVTISTNGGVGISQLYSENITLPNGFAVNDIFAFETWSGNIGLIKITEVNAGATPAESTIKFDVKVETGK